jgi:hypothetical protein
VKLSSAFKLCMLVLALALCCSAQGPTVFINGDQGATSSGGGFALGGIALGSTSAGKQDKTSQVAQVLLDSCPQISITLDSANAHADYLLLLNQEADYAATLGRVMVLRQDKSVLFASKRRRISQVVKEGCKVILADWEKRHASPSASRWNVTTPQ